MPSLTRPTRDRGPSLNFLARPRGARKHRCRLSIPGRTSEVAGHFEVSVATIYRAIESGQLDALKLGTPGRGALRVARRRGTGLRQGVRTRVRGRVVDGVCPAGAAGAR